MKINIVFDAPGIERLHEDNLADMCVRLEDKLDEFAAKIASSDHLLRDFGWSYDNNEEK